jgi:hypothetical protein
VRYGFATRSEKALKGHDFGRAEKPINDATLAAGGLSGGYKTLKAAGSLVVAMLLMASAQSKKPATVDRLCGRVEHVQDIPDRKKPNNYSNKREGLKNLVLELYEWRDGAPCCTNLTRVDTRKSGKGGRFDFEPQKPGPYWLVTNWNERDCKLAIVLEPQKTSSTVCSEQGLQVDGEGNADWWVTITLD